MTNLLTTQHQVPAKKKSRYKFNPFKKCNKTVIEFHPMKDIQPGIGEEAFSLLMHANFGMNVWGSGGISICILNHGTRQKLSGRLHILAISHPSETVACTTQQEVFLRLSQSLF